MTVDAAIWNDARVEWRSYDAVVFRSTWDYHLHYDAFAAWLDRLDADGVPLLNDSALVRWNADKRYIAALAGGPFAVPDTVFVPRGTAASLASTLRVRGWRDAVVKPTISADGHETFRVSADDAAGAEMRLDTILRTSDAMIQRYVPEIATEGESSLIVVDGAFSHAVSRRPAPADFRVQERFGGTIAPASPPAGLVERARALVARAAPGCLYARVDVVNGEPPTLMELELIEPSLYFGTAPGSAERFASAVLKRLR